MRTLINFLIIIAIIISAGISHGQTLEEYIKKAENYHKSGKLEQATISMEEAVKKYPDDSTANSYLGLYIGMQAGRTKDNVEAGQLIGRSFEILDTAVSLDENNPIARYHRGLLGIKVPEFLGKLEGGIRDLEFLIKIYERSPDKVKKDMLIGAYDLLGQGYQKKC